MRFPSSLVRSVADAARELPARGSSEKRSFARIRGGGGRGQARTTRPRKTVGQAVIRSSARRELGEPETGAPMSSIE